ncbi:hypothetical protein VNO78_03072 [Psophocarpus tetragonolobus]|uniref:Protein FAR1-RELATED SEQUENCE n=1 Tax=Psophocarpus tetragonolobus TaxID=3891 RepID=A0AAN9T3Q3_PSOTE
MWFGYKRPYTNESEPDEKIGFWKQEKKRQRQCFDAKATLAYLCHLRSTTDPAMFWTDFKYFYTEPVLITALKPLEKSVSKVFAREIFVLFRSVIGEGCKIDVIDYKEIVGGTMYTVKKYLVIRKTWHVPFFPSTLDLTCSCLKMESLGIPCDHIVGVLKHLSIWELPKCLVLDRWTKKAKESMERENDHVEMLQAENSEQRDDEVIFKLHFGSTLREPARVRSIEYGATSSSVSTKGKQITCYGVCSAEGHNWKSCPVQMRNDCMVCNNDNDNDDGGNDDGFNVELLSSLDHSFVCDRNFVRSGDGSKLIPSVNSTFLRGSMSQFAATLDL